MKIVSWNCYGAFRKKFHLLDELNADIVVVQECEDPARTKDKKYVEWASNYYWISENKNKGLGVFAKPDIKLQALDWDDDGLKYFIPCRVNQDFNLISVWCHGANSPTFGYIGQMWKYIQLHRDKLEKCIIAGDFNSNAIWDKWDRWWNHSDVVRELSEVDIHSVYHHLTGKEQGKETQYTFYMQKNLKKPYHIDYFFIHREFLPHVNSFTVGDPNQWMEHSDHMPILVEIDRV